MTDGGGGGARTGLLGDAWPALAGRPVLRRSIGAFLMLCAGFTMAVIAWAVIGLTRDTTRPETDQDRAERLAGLRFDQHPGKGRYYIPSEAVYTRQADGSPVAYLHYRLGGGQDVNVDDFLLTYGLPAPGPAAPFPADLAAALTGEEPAQAPVLPEAGGATGRRIYVVRSSPGSQAAGDIYVRATG